MIASLATGQQGAVAQSAWPYPVSREEAVVDSLHGEAVEDPYRWLEAGDSPEVAGWVAAQNTLTRRVLDERPERAHFLARLQQLARAPRREAPVHRGNYYFFWQRDGRTAQPVLMVQEGAKGEPRALLDSYRLDTEGRASVDWWQPSPNGELLAFGYSKGGGERSTLRILDVRQGKLLPEQIPNCAFGSVAWQNNGRGFFYTRYPDAGVRALGKHKVFFHHAWKDPQHDDMVFEHPGGPEVFLRVQRTPNDRYMVIYAHRGTSPQNEVYLYNRRGRTGPRPITEGFKASYSGEVVNNTLYMRTDDGAPRGRVVAVSLRDPEREHWKEIVPQADEHLQGLTLAGGNLILEYVFEARGRLRLFDLQGRPRGPISLPGLGTVEAISAEPGDKEAFIAYTSFLNPLEIFRFDLKTAKLTSYYKRPLPIDADAYIDDQVWVTSRDGTRVPMFLVYRKGTQYDRHNPGLLSGYGGFGVSMSPTFSAGYYAWLERGGVVAVPALRGGSEFGEAWHQAGMGARKQNVFDDFAAAAEYLIRERITSPERLAIAGGSNGGLLVGAALTQRPELFKAAVADVPLLDMLRYHKFLLGHLWVPEYGSADDPRQYRYLKAYSPYHRVRPGLQYPATLLRAGAADGRVDALHARKMAARLQNAQAGPNPVLLHVEAAGHGAGRPLDEWISSEADRLGFLAWQVGMFPEFVKPAPPAVAPAPPQPSPLEAPASGPTTIMIDQWTPPAQP